MVLKVEEIQERRDVKRLEAIVCNMSQSQELRLIQNIIEQACWHGPVTREWLEKEMEIN